MERIIKVSENQVVVETVYYKDSEGKEEIVVSTTTYGQSRINADLALAQANMDYWNTVDIVAEKAKVQARIDRLGLIQAEMDK